MSALTNDILVVVGQNSQEPGLPSAVRMFTINHFTSINKTSSTEFRKLNQCLKIKSSGHILQNKNCKNLNFLVNIDIFINYDFPEVVFRINLLLRINQVWINNI